MLPMLPGLGCFAAAGGGTAAASRSFGYFTDDPVNKAGLGDAIGNAVTGNLDFNRQKYFFDRQIEANNAAAALDRAFNAEEAQKNRDFQREQSNTQYLRAAEQLRKLGINPAVLAFGGSAGAASMSSGSSASSGSHGVSGASWSRGSGLRLNDLFRLSSALLNVASFAFL